MSADDAKRPAIADARVRERALDPRHSFIVQAPAGSGKTELLVRRYLKLLTTVEQPEEILAITFTRKAAAEMKRRVLDGLPSVLDAGRIADIAPRLRVQTIDALCASLTRQMPVLARFGAQPETVDDAGELYLDAARRVLALEPPNTPAERLLMHLDNNLGTARELIAAMLRRRDQWLRKTGRVPSRAELEATFVAERERLVKRAQALLPDASAELAQELLTKTGGWRKKHKRAQSLEAGDADGSLHAALAALLALPPAAYTESQWEALSAMLELLPRAVAHLQVVFAEQSQADFTEIAQGAVRALGDADAPTDLLLSLDVRIKHILVDEFQDTSISQWELLERLTAGWQSDDGRTLFAVGDPMQSIYRFREAEVGLFLHARRTGIGNVPLDALRLATNFRSQAGIVDWVNATFPRVLPAAEDETLGAVPYSPSIAHHTPLDGDPVCWHLFDERADEAQRVVEIAQAARALNPTGSIAILVRNRTHLDHIVPALQLAGIRYRAVEIERLGEKQGVQDLYALTRALMHPADRTAWLAVLRAPWCGLAPTQLAALAEGAHGTVWEWMHDDVRVARVDADARGRLERVRTVLDAALAHRLRGSLRDRVEGAWLALGGPACCSDATDLEDAEIFLDELAREDEAGDLAEHGALEESLEKLYALPDMAAGVDAIEIMTVHKAKGLEFDTVIMPGLDRTQRHNEPPLIIWKALAGDLLLLAPIREAGTGKDAAYDYVRNLERQAEDIEAGRLFYVAATRAVSRLHLTGCIRRDDHGAAKLPAKRSLLSKVWTVASEYVGAAPAPHTPEPTATAPPQTLVRFKAEFAFPALPPAARWQAPPADVQDNEVIEFSWAGETARHVGTVVHRWLQRIADDALAGWTPARVEALRPRLARELERRGVSPAECEDAATRVVRSLAQTLQDERGRWLLGPRADARSEYRVRRGVGNVLHSYVMDRVFRDDDGARWIADYKTSSHEGGEVGAFLDRERVRYAAQLERYAAALGEPRAKLGLYFPLLAGWREWESKGKGEG
jgi:ATP-dependent exoDNAse (exonuclease V) beta subunit